MDKQQTDYFVLLYLSFKNLNKFKKNSIFIQKYFILISVSLKYIIYICLSKY